MAGDRGGDRLNGRLFAAIDVGEAEEQAYRLLLERPGASLLEIAELLDMPRTRARRVVEALEVKGLLSRSPERVPRYLPVSPDVAVEALLARKQVELDQARTAAARLAEGARRLAARRTQQEVVEVITGSAAVVRLFDELQARAEHQVLALDRPPYAGTKQINTPQLHNLARGVSYRAIYDRGVLESAGGLECVLRYAKAGEEQRVFSPLPSKLMIFDREVALVPHLDPEQSEVTGAVLVRSRALLDMFLRYFEVVWDRATPIHIDTAGKPSVSGGAATVAERTDFSVLVSLLASGLKDEAIALQLGVSSRTLDRRVRGLMRDLDATTRFQAGWLAAQRVNGVEPPKQPGRTGPRSAAKRRRG